jgi:hypothetical protein
MDSSLSLAEQPAKPNADIMPAKPALHRMRLVAAMLFAALPESAFGTKRTSNSRRRMSVADMTLTQSGHGRLKVAAAQTDP